MTRIRAWFRETRRLRRVAARAAVIAVLAEHDWIRLSGVVLAVPGLPLGPAHLVLAELVREGTVDRRHFPAGPGQGYVAYRLTEDARRARG